MLAFGWSKIQGEKLKTVALTTRSLGAAILLFLILEATKLEVFSVEKLHQHSTGFKYNKTTQHTRLITLH